MVLLLSLLSDPTIVDKKGHTVLEACIRSGTSGVSLHKTRHNPACAEALLSTAVSTNNKELVDKNLLLIFNLKMFLKSKEGQWNETEARNVLGFKNMLFRSCQASWKMAARDYWCTRPLSHFCTSSGW